MRRDDRPALPQSLAWLRNSVLVSRLYCGRPIATTMSMRSRAFAILIGTCGLAAAQPPSSEGGSPEHYSDVEITWHIFKPSELPAPHLSQLHVPTGFRIQKFAENIGNARILAIGQNGNVYVTRREEGDVLMFRVGPDGLATGQAVRVASRSGLHGIAFQKARSTWLRSMKFSKRMFVPMELSARWT